MHKKNRVLKGVQGIAYLEGSLSIYFSLVRFSTFEFVSNPGPSILYERHIVHLIGFARKAKLFQEFKPFGFHTDSIVYQVCVLTI